MQSFFPFFLATSLRDEKDKINSDHMNQKTVGWTVKKQDLNYYTELNRKYKEAVRHGMKIIPYADNDSFSLSDIYINKNYDSVEYIDGEFGSEQPVRFLCSNLLTNPKPYYVYRTFRNETLPEKDSNMAVFKRYPSLISGEEIDFLKLNTLTKALLGLLDRVGYRFNQGAAILNDEWAINLQTTNTENFMMDIFLRGISENSEKMKNQWENHAEEIDLNEEMADLIKAYTDATKHLIQKENQKLSYLISYMKDFIKSHEDRKEVERKLERLVEKLDRNRKSSEDDDEDEE